MSAGWRLGDLVRERAEAQPDRPALRDGERVLTYREMLGEVRARSKVLAGTGIPSGSPVAVRISRNLDSVLAVLAVVDAGYAYLPIEAGWPPERARYVLDNAGAHALIEPSPQGITVTRRDAAGPTLPHGTAYVLYTSGSTGRPKGVAVSHANVLSMLEATTGLFALGADDVWTVFHSLCFDFSVWELWGALYCGGCAVVVEQRAATNLRLLVDLIARTETTVLCLVPSIFRRFADACSELGWPKLPVRYVMLGGEAIDRAQCLRWIRNGRGAGELINMYGITETTVFTTFKPLRESDLTTPSPYSPIGHALPSFRVDMLGPDCRPAPVGEIAEIAISGDGVALQYVANPAETAARFVALELDGEPRRCFRTGDLAIRDENGGLHLVGRADTQVKVNGYRIELAEIEAALADHPQVSGCVATTVSVAGGTARLAMLVASAAAITAAELRTHLLDRLPPYLVPGLLYVVDELPLNDNGKVDRAASKARIESIVERRETADAGR